MKTLIQVVLALAACCLCQSLYGQEEQKKLRHDASMWTRSNSGSTSAIPWYTYSGRKVVVDVRHNYDANRTAGICVGKKFGGESLNTTPEACGYVGDLPGYGPEVMVAGKKGRFSFFSQNQYVHGANPRDSFAYHWTDTQVGVTKHFSLGPGWQACRTTGKPEPGQKHTTAVDLGPSVKVSVGSIYFRAWPCWGVDPRNRERRGDPSLFLGIGYAW